MIKLNTKFKKFLSISLLLLLCLLNISIKPNAKTETFTYTIPDKKIEDFSLSEIESIIGEHRELLSTYRSGSFLVNIPNGTSLPKLIR